MVQNRSFLESVFQRSEKARRPFQRLNQAVPPPGQPPPQQPQTPERPTTPERPPFTPEMLNRVAQPAPGQPITTPVPEIDTDDLPLGPISPELSSPDWVSGFYQREGRLPGASDMALRRIRMQYEQSKGRPPTRNELVLEVLSMMGLTEPQGELEF